jgi:3-phenylpropionate/trans-cinnamate dioxygenase ferredoxin subunit
MAEVKVLVRKHGPYRMEAPAGTIALFDADGNEIDLQGKTSFSLCGCGHSATRPFCDGTHKTLVFPEAAPSGQKQEG